MKNRFTIFSSFFGTGVVLCLLSVAATTQAQTVVSLPVQTIAVEDQPVSEAPILLSRQQIYSHTESPVEIAIRIDLSPVLSAPVVETEQGLISVSGDFIVSKTAEQEGWKPIGASEPAHLSKSVESVVTVARDIQPESVSCSDSFNSWSAVLSHEEAFGLISELGLPFSGKITSVFTGSGTLGSLAVILDESVQLTFTRNSAGWLLTGWLVLDSSGSPVSLTTSSDRSASPPGMLPVQPVTFSFKLKGILTFSGREQSREFKLLQDSGNLNSFASGWSPTVGTVYDRNLVTILPVSCPVSPSSSHFISTTDSIINSLLIFNNPAFSVNSNDFLILENGFKLKGILS